MEAQKGERLFAGIGCAECHTPQMKTGPNAIGIPEGLDVPLYSDLLTHDLGESLNDHLIQGVAQGPYWRTTPLWGLRHRRLLLHDGRAGTVEEAIRFHGGEGAKVRGAYEALPAPDQGALKAFLLSL
ncbi:hypothetical protein D3C86_1059560 [compost metagenome]